MRATVNLRHLEEGPQQLEGEASAEILEIDKLGDEIIQAKEDQSGPISKQVIKLDGIPVGIASGAAIWAGLELAKRPENKGKKIVVIVPSSTERYLSSWLFADVDVESDSVESLIAPAAV